MKFRMVDQIVQWTPRRMIRGIKAVSFEEYSIRPLAEAGLPESLILESLVQLGRWLAVLSSGFKQTAVLAGLERMEFHRPLRPGRRMTVRLDVGEWGQNGVIFRGAAADGPDAIATATGCELLLRPLADFAGDADLRVLAGEICRPAEGET